MAIDSLLKVRDTLNWVDRTDNRDFISQPNSPILESEKRKDESGDKFKDVVQNKDIIDIDKPFCLYCEKILSENFSNGYLKSNFVLREHLDCDMDHETKIKVFSTQSINNRLTLYSLNLLPNGHFLSCELASAVLPFSLSGRGQYKSVLRMMSIFHDEIIKQEILFEEINQTVTHSKKLTVRQALKIPKTMVD
ncbi:8613_t:CDS:2 [Rhizophagus irregularis]|nr:8613_t:CDS:2 [Rhizophagus irregularis]